MIMMMIILLIKIMMMMVIVIVMVLIFQKIYDGEKDKNHGIYLKYSLIYKFHSSLP